ncbi:hypothetical protein ACIGXF_09240 [Streptomyces sp. NPDC053086]|uniref:hypothetical protein n=1 Tax=unclassified Streptomyces TaxID=2593676 RepID=UPI0037D30CF6
MSTTLSPERIELGRFFAVAAERLAAGHTVVEMFSSAVDAEWHRFLDDPEYAAFCTDHARGVLGHAAAAGAGGIDHPLLPTSRDEGGHSLAGGW